MLHPGDALVLFSDGVTDAQNAADEEFGEARLLDVLRVGSPVSRPTVIIDRVFDAIEAFVGGHAAVRRHDDARRAALAFMTPGCRVLTELTRSRPHEN